MIKKSCWIAVFVLMATSCLDEPECFSLNNNILGLSFKNLSDSSPAEVLFSDIRAIGSEIIFGTNVTASKIYLPLNYFTDSTAFILQQADITDTLIVRYSVRTQFVSEECGERFVLMDLDIIQHTFDSVRLIQAIPARDANVTHIEIFR